MDVKIGWIQIKMGHPLAQNGAENEAALAPFHANGAHPSARHRSKYIHVFSKISINMISYWARCAHQIYKISINMISYWARYARQLYTYPESCNLINPLP